MKSKAKGSWGIKKAKVIAEYEKPNAENSIVRVRTIETLDGEQFVDIRNWYNKQGEDDFPNQGKGIWVPRDTSVLMDLGVTLQLIAEDWEDANSES